MRYNVIADWLKRDVISDSMLIESDLTNEELKFLTEHTLSQIQRDDPKLLRELFKVK